MEFRYAERGDTKLILEFIRDLASYEKLLDEVVADEKTLEHWIFDKTGYKKSIGILKKS